MPTPPIDRRDVLKLTQAAVATAMVSGLANRSAAQSGFTEQPNMVEKNMIGAYGEWAANRIGERLGEMSFLREEFSDVDQWRAQARERVRFHLQQPDPIPAVEVSTDSTEILDGVTIEHLSWQLPFGPRTRALLLKPENAAGKMPGILGLHDHGGIKFFGVDKITKTNAKQHPMIVDHQASDYGGFAWANEFAKQGYVVLVHDVFTFGSRRVLPRDLPERLTRNLPSMEGDSSEVVQAYNDFASDHEHLMAKSLYCAGTTWPGVFTWEDQRALDILCARPEVDAERVGCAGLSGGGLRTAYLSGLDDRIRCACCVGMMTTWRDYLLHKAYTHTWMIYIPGLPNSLDYPEIMAMRAPLPTMVLNNNEDPLFTLPEMQRADVMMKSIFAKAGAPDRYRCSFYPGPHKFDAAMQVEAASWFDRWLKA